MNAAVSQLVQDNNEAVSLFDRLALYLCVSCEHTAFSALLVQRDPATLLEHSQEMVQIVWDDSVSQTLWHCMHRAVRCFFTNAAGNQPVFFQQMMPLGAMASLLEAQHRLMSSL